jgi:hypothetical protein
MGLFSKERSLADLAEKPPKLLIKKWFSLCSHPTGFWAGTNTIVSDTSGNYLRMVGDCKTCEESLVAYRSLDKP